MRQKQLSVIILFVGINIFIGRLFQESLNLVCSSELLIIGLSSLMFWSVFSKKVEKVALYSDPFKNTRGFIIHTGIGLSVSFVNILISQIIVILSMMYIYNCTSPSFGFLNASLTNNLALNLLCYLSLVLLYVNHSRSDSKKDFVEDSSVEKPSKIDGEKFFLLNSGNKKQRCLVKEIDYIEASNNCIILHTEKGQFVKYVSLKSFYNEELPNEFQRVHRSFVINSKKVEYVQKNKNGDGVITLKNGEKVKLSRSFKLNLN